MRTKFELLAAVGLMLAAFFAGGMLKAKPKPTPAPVPKIYFVDPCERQDYVLEWLDYWNRQRQDTLYWFTGRLGIDAGQQWTVITAARTRSSYGVQMWQLPESSQVSGWPYGR